MDAEYLKRDGGGEPMGKHFAHGAVTPPVLNDASYITPSEWPVTPPDSGRRDALAALVAAIEGECDDDQQPRPHSLRVNIALRAARAALAASAPVAPLSPEEETEAEVERGRFVEEHIAGLQWSADTSDYCRTLVAGNLRHYDARLRRHLAAPPAGGTREAT